MKKIKKSKILLNNKFIIFRRAKRFFYKKNIKTVLESSMLRDIYFERIKILSKTLFFLKNYFNFKKNKFFNNFNDFNDEVFENSSKFFGEFLNINFYTIWVLRYKLLKIFMRKTIAFINFNNVSKNKRERIKLKFSNIFTKIVKPKKVRKKKKD